MPCKNETLGDGKEGDLLTGPCEKGKEGTINYKCTSGRWTETDRNCILQVIKDIEKQVEVIFIFYVLVKKKLMSISNISDIYISSFLCYLGLGSTGHPSGCGSAQYCYSAK